MRLERKESDIFDSTSAIDHKSILENEYQQIDNNLQHKSYKRRNRPSNKVNKSVLNENLKTKIKIVGKLLYKGQYSKRFIKTLLNSRKNIVYDIDRPLELKSERKFTKNKIRMTKSYLIDRIQIY